ncbi:MAG: hypothetical protein CMO03_02550 [Thalassospira sp.]|jgi:hypothetical protein|uniref:Uncharacterized protein n=2 Tax=Thalassospiraceae TaxID=2844866 RepID=A0ABR5XXP4_9PROT|nr:hypothetical protein AUP40_21560 [Thalassospira xiamenensis]MAL28395.1 hypothetical protein [Thalassospira sp.]HBN47925.1 hypothetical protein [Thalassospira sp.]|tara:strand:+ start:11775 stop:12095 length:321 start_codon:yes stop_codon:yes gene_type:complete
MHQKGIEQMGRRSRYQIERDELRSDYGHAYAGVGLWFPGTPETTSAIRIAEMQQQHLKNAIDFLEREIVAIESELLSGALKSKEAVEGHIYAVNSKISEMKKHITK